MKKREKPIEEFQIETGEKLKLIFRKINGKHSMDFLYLKSAEGNIGLIITWHNMEVRKTFKTFLFTTFGIEVIEIKDDKDMISLDKVVKSNANPRIKNYFDENCNGTKILDSHIKEIIEKIQASKQFSDNFLSIVENNEELKTLPVIDTDIGKNYEVNPEITTKEFNQIIVLDEEKVIGHVVKPIKTKNVSKTKKEKREPKYSLNKFFVYLVLFEERLDSPSVKDLSKLFTWETDGSSQILVCQRSAIADKLELAVRWHIGNNYKVGPKITRDGNKIIIDYSFPENHIKEKKVTTRSYCLAPNEFSTVGDIEERLHRVYHLPKPVIKKIGDYFKVEYKKKPLAKYVHNIINAMGWKSKVKDNILTVFTGLLPNETTRDIEITPVVDDKTENTLSPVHTDRDVFDLSIHSVVNESPFFIINSKEEALIELKKLYFDPQLSTELSEETKNDIHFVLQENWKKTHPEEYAIALLDFLKK